MWNGSENKVKIVLIRHGMTASNLEHKYLGRTDEELCNEGIALLEDKKKTGYYPYVDYVFASPMKRCVQTAEILYPNKGIIKVSEWEEIDFGEFEGKSHIDLQDDEYYQKWIDSNGALPFPNGEGREQFIKRCKQGLYEMQYLLFQLQQEENLQDITVGLVVHGGTIMALLSNFYGGEYFDYQIENGTGYVCTLDVSEEYPKFTGIEKLPN